MKKLLVPISFIALLIIVGCSNDTSQNESTSTADAESNEEVYDVRINQAFQSLLYLPLYVADQKGFFEEENINLIRQTAGGGMQAWTSVLGGSSDFSIHDPVFAPMSREQDGPGIVVAAVQDGPSVWILGDPEEGSFQDDPTKFEGSIVTTNQEPDTWWAYFTYLMTENGLDPGTDVEIMQVPIGNEVPPVLVGQADFAAATEPMISQGLAEGLDFVYEFPKADGWSPYAFSSLVTTEEYLENNPEAAQGVVNAFEKASQFIHKYPEEAIEVAKVEFPDLEPEIVEDAVLRVIEENGYPEHALLSRESWDNAMKINVHTENVKEYPSEYSSYENLVNTELAEKAAESITIE